MLAAILAAAGLRTAAVGNIGVSLLDVVLGAGGGYDVLAVELSSYQLHWAPSIRPHSAAVLNLAPDHLDWHGSMAAYAADKGRIYHGNQVACVYNAADPRDRAPGARGRRRGGLPGDRLHPRRPPALASSAWSTACWSTGPSWTTGSNRAQELAETADVTPAGPAQHRQRPGRRRPRPRLRRRTRRRTRGTARLPARRAPHRARSPSSTASPTSTTPRPPTPTPPRRRWPRTTRSCGSPAASPRAPTSTTWPPRPRPGCARRCCSAPTAR